MISTKGKRIISWPSFVNTVYRANWSAPYPHNDQLGFLTSSVHIVMLVRLSLSASAHVCQLLPYSS